MTDTEDNLRWFIHSSLCFILVRVIVDLEHWAWNKNTPLDGMPAFYRAWCMWTIQLHVGVVKSRVANLLPSMLLPGGMKQENQERRTPYRQSPDAYKCRLQLRFNITDNNDRKLLNLTRLIMNPGKLGTRWEFTQH